MMNATTNPPPVGPLGGDEVPPNPQNPEQKNVDSSAITVAAPAASLFLVLAAIVVWFFLVRKQLRKNAKESKRLGSKRSHSGSLKDSQSRHSSIKASRLSQQGSSPFSTPRSHRKSGGSPKDKRRSCNCTCKVDHEERHREMCTCGRPHSPAVTANGISTVCTGNSPFCPHSNKMKHYADIHSRGSSSSFDLDDMSPLSEHNNVITYEKRGRANTGDHSTLAKHGKTSKETEDISMVLRRSVAGYPLKNCTCHPLNGLERKPCSCALKHPLSHVKRKANADNLYFSAPSLVHKQFNIC